MEDRCIGQLSRQRSLYLRIRQDMKSSGIGGQAVLEGVMMRNGEDYAIAVRKSDGSIVLKKEK